MWFRWYTVSKSARADTRSDKGVRYGIREKQAGEGVDFDEGQSGKCENGACAGGNGNLQGHCKAR